jgi:hypothetical protein
MKPVDPNHIVRKVPYVGGETLSGTVIETVYRSGKEETAFAVFDSGEVRYEPLFRAGIDEAFVPFSPQNNLIRNGIILFPSETEEYETTEALVDEIRRFIHQYVTVSPLFEIIAAHYVLLTWIYESFGTLPYLRVRGDFGSGKTRFLKVIGSLCFRAIFAGSATVSPLFRMLNIFRGTLVVDEGDFRVSDEKAELTKVLNNGNAKGFPVLRSEQSGSRKEFNPVAYDVFGPKVLATRGYYQDAALESRFITEDMSRHRPRAGTPVHLPNSFSQEAEHLRNKLLLFRFRNLKHYSVTEVTESPLEPRLSQIFAPLLAIVADEKDRHSIVDLISDYSRELALDRSIDIESRVVEVIKELWKGEALPLREVTARLNERHADEFQEVVSGKRVGFVIRKLLGVRTRKRSGVFEILPTEEARIEGLFRRFGLPEESSEVTL